MRRIALVLISLMICFIFCSTSLGHEKVTVVPLGVSTKIPDNLVPENIREDVVIMGVMGSFACEKTRAKTMFAGQAKTECDQACSVTYPLHGFYYTGCLYGCQLSKQYIDTIFDNNCE